MIRPTDYYEACGDVLAETFSDILSFIETIEVFAKARGYLVYWRGQANHEWGLTSSLVRMLSTASVVNDDALDEAETRLLGEAVDWIEDLRDPSYTEPLAKL